MFDYIKYITDGTSLLKKHINNLHILTYAKVCSSPLSKYSQHYSVDKENVVKHAMEANTKDKVITLFPNAPISIVPIRLVTPPTFPGDIATFFASFLLLNANTIMASNILVSLNYPMLSADVEVGCLEGMLTTFKYSKYNLCGMFIRKLYFESK